MNYNILFFNFIILFTCTYSQKQYEFSENRVNTVAKTVFDILTPGFKSSIDKFIETDMKTYFQDYLLISN